MIVYRITHTASGRKYIGITRQTLEQRWSGHIRQAASSPSSAIQKAIAQYGHEAFSIEQVATATSPQQLCLLENEFIKREATLCSQGGFNGAMGGGRGRPATKTPSAFLSMRISASLKERIEALAKGERRTLANWINKVLADIADDLEQGGIVA